MSAPGTTDAIRPATAGLVDHLPHGLVHLRLDGLLTWFEPWFLAYLLLAAIQGGILPMLLPLDPRGAAAAGLILAASTSPASPRPSGAGSPTAATPMRPWWSPA